jgi:hypothetical protein
LGTQVLFEQEGKIVQGMVLRTIQWEGDDAYYEIQLANGNRVSVPVSENIQTAEERTYVYPGGDCQV